MEYIMKIAVSACLLGENCKYNGGNNFSQKVIDFVKGHQVVPVCPEVLGGGIVMQKNGNSVDAEFRKGAQIALKKILDRKIELVILQSRSPSCGVNMIYDGSFSGKLISGQGVFAKLLKENNINVVDVENL